MTVKDTRKRKVKDAEGNIYIFRLRRLQCVECHRIHIEAPDFIVKNKHYSKTVIDEYLSGKNTNIAADNKTLYLWRKGK